jgi:predicted transcriptional regulator
LGTNGKESGTGSGTIMTTAEARTKLHDLVESLPSDDVPTALRVLEALTSSSDPMPLALRDIPFDDEPETEEERAAVAEAYRDIEEGRGIPHDEVMRKYGL